MGDQCPHRLLESHWSCTAHLIHFWEFPRNLFRGEQQLTPLKHTTANEFLWRYASISNYFVRNRPRGVSVPAQARTRMHTRLVSCITTRMIYHYATAVVTAVVWKWIVKKKFFSKKWQLRLSTSRRTSLAPDGMCRRRGNTPYTVYSSVSCSVRYQPLVNAGTNQEAVVAATLYSSFITAHRWEYHNAKSPKFMVN